MSYRRAVDEGGHRKQLDKMLQLKELPICRRLLLHAKIALIKPINPRIMIDKAKYDAWKVNPPCNHGDIDHCHECPYYEDCWGVRYPEDEE